MVTPGLGDKARSALRRTWERQGRTCHYCGGAPETVDHVVPLVRGGTNYEGNLVPACRKCNASKCDLLLVEWRYGKPRGSDGALREWMNHPRWVIGKAAARPRRVTSSLRPLCSLCGEPCPKGRRKFCSDHCGAEWNARRARDAYRALHGIPVDVSLPTKRSRRDLTKGAA